MRLKGLGVSAGTAVGRAVIFAHRARDVRYRVRPEDVDGEAARLERATSVSRDQLTDIRARLTRAMDSDQASIFDAQLLMLDDPMLTGHAAELIRSERLNAEWALRRAADELIAGLDAVADRYLRERKADIADVAGRVRLNLRDVRVGRLGSIRVTDEGLIGRVAGPVILVADELSPSIVAQVDWEEVAGFVSDAGSWTYHTAILARSLRVPAVVGLTSASALIPPGARIAIDGSAGEVLLDPTDAEVAALETRVRRARTQAVSLDDERGLPAITPDGVRITLEANIELADEAADARSQGAEGIGLVRSEYLIAASDAPTEDAQLAAYRASLETMAPARVTIRTFDGQDAGRERSRTGLRGLRHSLASPDAFRIQLRALLRAARFGRLRVMFPFVTSVDELREARRITAEVAARLAAEEEAPPDVPLGAMIEVPAAAVAADLLAADADFLAVGTNDLVQFALAVDRADEQTSHLYDPLHPAILRLVRQAVRGAGRFGRPLAVCGEMAADPALAVLLVGLGVTELSMRPGAIPLVTRVLRSTPAADARRLAARALRSATREAAEHALAAELTDQRMA
jgi:phosphoenolpyruvate-protein phosphotransferase (PTS system enzyme I)